MGREILSKINDLWRAGLPQLAPGPLSKPADPGRRGTDPGALRSWRAIAGGSRATDPGALGAQLGAMLRSSRATDPGPVRLAQARPPGAGGYYAGFPDRWGRQKKTRPAVSLGGLRGAAARAFYFIKE